MLGRGACEAGYEVAKLRVRVRLEAYADIDQAFDYYVERTDDRVITNFLSYLDEAFERISAFPQSCPAHRYGIRRLLLGRFPYWVYYRVVPDEVEVIAVLHTKRDSTHRIG